MQTGMRKLASDYVKGKISRDRLIQHADSEFISKIYHKESIFYNLLEIIFEDPDDNELEITRAAIIQVLSNYNTHSFSIEEVGLWFWDVLNLNVSGNESEQELIGFLLYLFDNLEINGLTDGHILKITEILKNVLHAERALAEIRKVLEQ